MMQAISWSWSRAIALLKNLPTVYILVSREALCCPLLLDSFRVKFNQPTASASNFAGWITEVIKSCYLWDVTVRCKCEVVGPILPVQLYMLFGSLIYKMHYVFVLLILYFSCCQTMWNTVTALQNCTDIQYGILVSVLHYFPPLVL